MDSSLKRAGWARRSGGTWLRVSSSIGREAGFRCCLSCFGGTNPAFADPFHLKRVGMTLWHGSPFQFGFQIATNRV